jgi:hypothetical protein
MGFLHPFLLAGLAAVMVPILIHLLLRQRPRPRPWAAMRWLLAAAQQASRRYRLTNYLLLLLRMLLVALIALAISRPLLGGMGGGERLVIVLDRTASMGSRGGDAGPFAAALARLAQAELPYRQVALVTVDAQAELVLAGTPAAVRAALPQLTVSALPGGLDRAAREPLLAGVLAAFAGERPDVLLISDFQQDHGDALVAALSATSRQVLRWSPLPPLAAGANATVLGSGPLPDVLPGQGGELAALISGFSARVTLAVDESPAVEVPAIGLDAIGLDVSGEPTAVHAVTVPVPPLPAGAHRLRLRFDDAGLSYDNLLDLPVTVRPAVPAVLVAQAAVVGDYLGAALKSDERCVTVRSVRPAVIAAEPLPSGGLLALRSALPSAVDAKRVSEWVGDGGVLWASLRVLSDDQALAPLIANVRLSGARSGGPWNTGSTADKDLDALLGLAGSESMPQVALPVSAEVLLRAGEAPAVVALPVGRGWVIIELTELIGNAAWQARGSTPLWALRMARRYTARAAAVPMWTAGDSAPATTTLKLASEVVTAVAGEPLVAAPGTWLASDGATIVVLPNRDEGRLDRPLAPGIASDWVQVFRQGGNADIGALVALAALAVAVVEGLLAAWAGRTYGR